MGSLFRLPPREVDAETLFACLRDAGVVSIGADANRGEPYDETKLTGPAAFVFGGEGAGLPESVAAHLDRHVRIRMRRGVDSLSVGAAAAVLLFEAARQRR